MPNILIIDTSSHIGTVVLSVDGYYLEKTCDKPRSQSKLLLSMITEVLNEASLAGEDIDALAVVSGPGSFTGLRIGIGVVQGLSFSLSKPVILLSSLELLAMDAASKSDCTGIIATIKSKADEIYFACYQKDEQDEVKLLGREQVSSPESVTLPQDAKVIDQWVGIGDGMEYRAEIEQALEIKTEVVDSQPIISTTSLEKLASAKFETGKTVSADQALPSYLKEQMHYRESVDS